MTTSKKRTAAAGAADEACAGNQPDGCGEAGGWPVVGTGLGRGDREGHVLWCRRLGLPEDDHDFSTHDVFDVLEFLIARESNADEMAADRCPRDEPERLSPLARNCARA